MTWDPTWDVRTVLAVIAAVTGALAFLVRWATNRWGESVKGIVVALKKVPTMAEDLERILEQVGTDHGASLRSAVDRIERGLAFQDLRAWALLQDMEHAIIETDGDGYLIRMNRTYMRWTGRAPAELLKDGWKNVIHPEDVARVVGTWESAVKDMRDVEMTFRILDVGGVAFTVRAHCYMIRGGGPKPLGWIANLYRLQDLEDKKAQFPQDDVPSRRAG